MPRRFAGAVTERVLLRLELCIGDADGDNIVHRIQVAEPERVGLAESEHHAECQLLADAISDCLFFSQR